MRPSADEPYTGALNDNGSARMTVGILTGFTVQVVFVYIAMDLFHTDFTGAA